MTTINIGASGNQLNEFQQKQTMETIALLPSDTTAVNSRDFVEKSDEILSSTSNLIITLRDINSTNEIFKRNGVKSILQISNRAGEHLFTIGQCPASENIERFVISNSVGHGIMSFTTKGFLNRECDIDGAGLLSFTQVQHFYGSYTLRDPYKDLVKIRSGWIPFCTCCLQQVASSSMTITDLDGTNSGSIVFEKMNTEFGASTLSLNFIPNLNPKAKYMLLAATIKLIDVYFSESGQQRQNCRLTVFYAIILFIFLAACAVIILCL